MSLGLRLNRYWVLIPFTFCCLWLSAKVLVSVSNSRSIHEIVAAKLQTEGPWELERFKYTDDDTVWLHVYYAGHFQHREVWRRLPKTAEETESRVVIRDRAGRLWRQTDYQP